MKPKWLDIDNSWVGIACTFVAMFVVVALLTSPPLTVLRNWTWDAFLGHGIALILAIGIGGSSAFGVTENLLKDSSGRPVRRSRRASYGVCLLIVIAASLLIGLIWSAPIQAGDEIEATHQVATVDRPGLALSERDALIKKLFLTFIVPSLVGVRMALGPKRKKTHQATSDL